MATEKKGHPLGIHRVIAPKGTLPQAAERIDNDFSQPWDNELVLEVERLNIDSASFRQMEEAGDVAAQILATVAARGKQHNPVTGSGGMLLGRVAYVGSALAAAMEAGRVPRVAVGDRVATLVSLTLTPLAIERILSVDPARHQVEIVGRAALFETSAFAVLPPDLPERVVLSALDVAGAGPQVARMTKPGARVLVLGCGGKSGLIACAAARRAGAGRIVGVERSAAAAAAAEQLGMCDAIVVADAADAVAVSDAAMNAGGGAPFDLTVSCVNVPDAEMGAILATRDGGVIYFFSMSTSFTKAALGAEGVSRDVTMVIGNGYAPGHAEATLALLREVSPLHRIFVERYG
jgi:L-erythro-3,5-diaminohexanoate dehydrogenase